MKQTNDISKNYMFEDTWSPTLLDTQNFHNGEVSIRIIKNTGDFNELREGWDNLVENSGATIYQTFEWLYNWWEYFGKDSMFSLHIIAVYLSGELISICPFYIQSVSFSEFRIYQRLRLLGSGLNTNSSPSFSLETIGLSDYLDIIVKNGYENLTADILLSYFTENKELFDEIDFQNVSDESTIYNSLIPVLQKNKFGVEIEHSDVCPQISLPNTVEKFIQSIKPNIRRKYKHVKKQTIEDTACEITTINKNSAPAAMQALKNLHQKRWNMLGYQGLFYDNRFEKFQLDIVNELYDKGMVWFKVFKYNNKIVAARLAYKLKGRMYDYLSGFDSSPEIAAVRPGIALILSMVEDSITEKIEVLDLLRGDEQYKFDINAATKHNYNISITVPGGPQPKVKSKIIRAVKIQRGLVQRLSMEKSIMKIHYEQHGSKTFLSKYTKFWIFRFKEYKSNKRKKKAVRRKNKSDKKDNSVSVESLININQRIAVNNVFGGIYLQIS